MDPRYLISFTLFFGTGFFINSILMSNNFLNIINQMLSTILISLAIFLLIIALFFYHKIVNYEHTKLQIRLLQKLLFLNIIVASVTTVIVVITMTKAMIELISDMIETE